MRPRILITAGPTREPLDPVRFLSNASTGAQGVALARAASERGWSVDLVHGPLQVPLPPGVRAHAVTTTREMLDACLDVHPQVDAVIGAAAVCDYRPRSIEKSKHKRGAATWSLELVPTEDILEALAAKKGRRVHAGFALETDDLVAHAADKLRRKRLDWIVANSPRAIGAGSSEYVLLGADGSRLELGTLTKEELAERLLERIEATLGA